MTNAASAAAAAPKPQPLRARDIAKFLASYKEAWETRNADLAASLFTRDARYRQNSFEEPIVGREAIHDAWNSATKRQQDIHFEVKNFFRNGFILVAEWTCGYRDAATGKRVQLAGMFLADFYGKQVRTFREYRHSRTVS